MQLLIFPLHPLFFLLSRKVSHFTLSHIWRYTGVQERSRTSLGMTIWGKRPSKHVRCTKRRISIPLLLGYAPRPVISSAASKSSLHSVLPCLFRKWFPLFRYLTYSAIPHTVISSAARNLPCTPSFLASFASGFPFSAISHRAIYRYARKIEGYARDDGTRITICKHFTAGFPLFCCLT